MQHSEPNFTAGKIPVQLFHFSVPLFFANVLQAAYHLVDMMVIGHFVGSSGLAAVGNASMLCFIINSIGIGITLGGTVDTNQLSADAGPEQSGAAQSEAPQPVPAPDFTVYDGAGNEVHLSDYLGKPVVLNFWASWCGPCRMEMPHFQEKQLELEGEVQFLMVNVTTGRETLESAQEFIAGQGYTFPVFYDTEADAAMAYGAYSLPATYFIDAEGYAIAHARGAIDAATLQTGIDMIAE